MPLAVIAGYAYNADQQTLEIRYHSGNVYHYLNVPEKVYKDMRSTTVKGIGFNRISKENIPLKKLRQDIRKQMFKKQ